MKPLTASLPETTATSSALARVGILLYGVTCYAIGVAGLVALILTCFGVIPFSEGPVVIQSAALAVLFNLGFVALFGIQHAIMARPEFKARWTKIIPAAMERSTFTAVAGALMLLALFMWQPLPQLLWNVEASAARIAIYAFAGLGWVYLLGATFAINHFELFGLQQVYNNLRQRQPKKLPFVQRFMYRFDRHPLMTGFLIGFWATPTMTMDRLILALGFTTYMVLGVAIEERDLIRTHGESYLQYKRDVGSLIPTPRRGA